MNAGSLVFPLLILAVVLLMLRSQRTRTRQAQQLRSGLVPGARVMTTSGLIAYVAEVQRDEVLLEVAHEVYCRYATAAIARVLPEEVDAEDGEDADGPAAEQASTPALDAAPTPGAGTAHGEPYSQGDGEPVGQAEPRNRS